MINVVGIGPGDLKMMTFQAKEAIDNSQVIVGYKTYFIGQRNSFKWNEAGNRALQGSYRNC